MAQAKSLSQAEFASLLDAISAGRYPSRDRLMLLLTFYAGLRVGEVAALKLGDVLNRDGSGKRELRLSPDQTKGRKSRCVMISERLAEEIRAYASVELRGLAEPLFVSQKSNTFFTPGGLANLFKSFYREAGLDNGSSHSGRRTFITNLVRGGVSVRIVQDLAGHSNMSTTQRYIDVSDIEKMNAVNKLM
jgi:Site-specific recombinase XerD